MSTMHAHKPSLGKEIWKNRHLYLLMAPFLIVFTVFIIIPIGVSIVLSFTDFNMLQSPSFVGLEKYIRMFLDDDVFIVAVRNTLIFAVLTGPVSYLLCFFLAWMINDLPPKFRWVLTLLFYAPALASNIFYIWTYIFSGDMYGLVNSALIQLSIIMEPIQWLTDSTYVMFVIIIVQLWMSLGIGFLAFIAGLQSVDASLFEAGAIDGIRNRWQQLWYITLPVMKSMLMFGAVMQISTSFSVSTVPMTLAGFPTLDDIHRLWSARSKDGVHFTADPTPAPWPAPDPIHPETCTYDPRITKIGDEYFLLYASDLNQNNVRVGIVKTKDFETFEQVSIASEFGNRNGCLFPEKFDGLYCRFDRPFGNELEPCSMWVSFSPDLTFWGKSRPLMYKGKPWIDGFKMGAGAVPIKTDKGWLEIYHTVSQTCNGFIYRLKAALLSLDDPGQVIGYTKDFILWPEHDYEMKGRVMNVVFTCNALPQPDGTVRIYYGAADTNIGLATGRIDELVAACLENQ